MRQVGRKRPGNSNRWIMFACYGLTILMGAVAFWATSHAPRPPGLVQAQPSAETGLDVTSLPPCPGEAGPIDRTPRRACTWDAATQGVQGPRMYPTRWLVYLPTCPAPFNTIQNHAQVTCISMNDWGE